MDVSGWLRPWLTLLERLGFAVTVDDLRAAGLLEVVTNAIADCPVSLSDVCGRGRAKHVSRARWSAWTALHERGLTYNAIANLWGVRPTSVKYGVTKFHAMCD